MRKMRNLAATFLFAGPLLLILGAGGEADWDEPTKKWMKGPVSYLATDEEAKQFKKLAQEDERADFIAEFWARRGPTPDTDANAFRDRFYTRVASADALMKEQGVPAGWKSAPGRVLILLGQPAEVKHGAGEGSGSLSPSYSSAAPSRVGAGGAGDDTGSDGGASLTFVYSDATRLGLAAALEITFQQEGLSFRLMTRVDLGTNAIRGLDREVLAAEFPAGAEPEVEQITLAPGAPATDQVPAEPDLAAGELSVQRRVLEALLDDGEVPEDLPAEAAIDLYKALNEKTYVAITLGLPTEGAEVLGLDPSDLHPIAALQDAADPENLYLYDSDGLFAPSDDDGADQILRFQAGDGVDPGTYTVVTGFVTADGETAGARVQELEVPDFSEPGVHLSSLTLATQFETTQEGGGELKRPYILGNRKIVPRVDTRYPLNGSLTLYYQIYNATEGSDGNPSLRISYNFYQKRGSRYVKAGTAPPADGVKDRVVIYELPLQGWPKGQYRIKVTVTDNLNGSFAERELSFQVD